MDSMRLRWHLIGALEQLQKMIYLQQNNASVADLRLTFKQLIHEVKAIERQLRPEK